MVEMKKFNKDFYDYFNITAKSENFFALLYTRIFYFTTKISGISDLERKNSKNFTRSRKTISNIIKLLQLFCENHCEAHQNYLRNQEKFRKKL